MTKSTLPIKVTSRRVWRAVAGVALLGIAAVTVASCGGSDDGARAASATATTKGEPAPTPTSTAAPVTADGCATSAPAARNIAYESVAGVPARLTSVDVYRPGDACGAPVVVWVHGGGWRKGDKVFGLADKIRLAREQGWVLVSVNYRLTDPSVPEPVRYPTHNEDVAAALAWVHDNIARYGGDPSRVAALGHSAGAQIVASIGTDERYLAAHDLSLSDLRCAGALDTEGFDVERMASSGNAIYRAAFGDDPATWANASPLRHVAPGKNIPDFLVVERGGPGRRLGQEAFANALRDAGVPVTVVDAGTLTHGQVNSQIGATGDTVMTPPLVSFLSGCFAS
jgi:acetyl esterase/lipase